MEQLPYRSIIFHFGSLEHVVTYSLLFPIVALNYFTRFGITSFAVSLSEAIRPTSSVNQSFRLINRKLVFLSWPYFASLDFWVRRYGEPLYYYLWVLAEDHPERHREGVEALARRIREGQNISHFKSLIYTECMNLVVFNMQALSLFVYLEEYTSEVLELGKKLFDSSNPPHVSVLSQIILSSVVVVWFVLGMSSTWRFVWRNLEMRFLFGDSFYRGMYGPPAGATDRVWLSNTSYFNWQFLRTLCKKMRPAHSKRVMRMLRREDRTPLPEEAEEFEAVLLVLDSVCTTMSLMTLIYFSYKLWF